MKKSRLTDEYRLELLTVETNLEQQSVLKGKIKWTSLKYMKRSGNIL